MLALLLTAVLTPPAPADAPPSPTEQRALADAVAAKAQRAEVRTDDDGNVTGLILINHQALHQKVGEKPGADDDDLLSLAALPKLDTLVLESQPVTDRGLAVLNRFPGMKQVGFHYMGKAWATFAADRDLSPVSPGFVTRIDPMRDLEILEIKHNFKVDAIAVDALKGPFPKVWRLVLDTPVTAEQTLHLARLCPHVRDLQLHRTDLSPEQLTELGALLPKLEVLWFKPRGGLKAEHLRALAAFPKLRIFSPQHFKNAVPYAGGWDALAAHPALERLEIAGRGAQTNAAALEELTTARPGLVVSPKLTRSRNYDGL
ncbi:hypothetical protein [Alienimonas sp. DA493]|uniref:hypothetical protein n=1 Tax=Alienimonas sp. DA493 TaxID=3373605 RepID=UPI0037542801